MAFQPLLRQRTIPLVALTTGFIVLPKTSAHADQPLADPIREIVSKNSSYKYAYAV